MTTDIPPIPPGPEPKKRSNLTIILIIAGSLIGIVCVCAVVGIGALTMLGNQVGEITNSISTQVAEQGGSSGDGAISTITSAIVESLETPTAETGEITSSVGNETPTAESTDTSSPEDTSTDTSNTEDTSTGGMTEVDGEGNTKIFTSTDGRSQVTAPSDWRTMPDLNDNAELEIGAAFSEKYLVVLTESEDDSSGYSLEEYAQTILDNFKTDVGSTIVSSPEDLTFNGLPAIQYEVRSTVDDLEIVYWLTAVQGEKNLFQVVGWTLAEEVETNRDEIREVIASFTEPK